MLGCEQPAKRVRVGRMFDVLKVTETKVYGEKRFENLHGKFNDLFCID